MATETEGAHWRQLATQAHALADAACDDPCDAQLTDALERLGAEVAALPQPGAGSATALSAGDRCLMARARLAAGEAWYALNRHEPALSEFDAALALLGPGPDSAATPDLARLRAEVLVNRCRSLVDLGQHVQALPLLNELIEWYAGQDRAADPAQQALLAQALHTLGVAQANAGDHDAALQATARAVQMRRRLTALDAARHEMALSRSLQNLANWLHALGRDQDAFRAREETVSIRRTARGRRRTIATGSMLAQALQAVLPHHAARSAEAVGIGQEAVELYRELAAAHPGAFQSALAMSLNNLGISLGEVGRRAEALDAVREAVELRRELAAGDRQAFLPDLATSLNNLGNRLSEVGRRAEALDATREAADLYRELAAADRQAFLPGLAASLNNLGNRLSEAGRRAEALDAAQEAVELRRELAAGNREAFLPDLATSLNNLGIRLGEVGRRAEALDAAQEALELRRELAAGNREAFLPDLAMSLNNLGNRLSEAGRRAEALDATFEAVDLHRELAAGNRQAFLPDLAGSLNNLSDRLSEAGRQAEALDAWRECGALVIDLPPVDPHRWVELARGPTRNLDTAQDLRNWHLPLLQRLTEHRELAFDAEHATLFLDLQGLAAARLWALLATLPGSDAALVDEAVAVLVATLHSPDLARWLQAQAAADGGMAELARLKCDMIEVDSLLDSLIKRLDGGFSEGGRSGWVNLDEDRAALTRCIDELALRARACREAFKERRRLLEADPTFRSAFMLRGMPALREAARHGRGAAVLCLLELPVEGSSEVRAVGALIHADGRPTQLLEFDGLHATTHGLVAYPSYVHSGTATPDADDSGAGAAAVPRSTFEELQQQMHQRFWDVLQQALHAAADGADIERMHVCGHGLLQQLPLGLRAAGDCPGLQLLAWPGAPYLRLAADRARAIAPDRRARPAVSPPWLVGHDCAWGSRHPLPMVAVEATLVRLLLEEHGQTVKVIERAAQLHADSAVLVLCCGDTQAQAHFDGELALGHPPLTMRQVVQHRLGPPLALLSMGSAGQTHEAAGNAFGVGAAFLLGGSRVVVASSKPVPDVLAPWLSTLMVWHVLQGCSLHDAAVTARQQFGKLDFPEDYRQWLVRALPQALATILPEGGEFKAAIGGAAHLALENVVRRWPWQGASEDLFSGDRSRRAQAIESVCNGVLSPRPEERDALAAEVHEMAAFVFVYGVD